jgi:DNA/RNA endonuclease YhcR with UshA esterase domain
MYALWLLVTSTAFVLWAVGVQAATLSAEEAAKHVGENATVCGVVAAAKYAAQVRGAPTFLDFGKPYPNATFTALILGSDRAKFGTPEKSAQGKQICVTGQIQLYQGKPEIILTDPKQLTEK